MKFFPASEIREQAGSWNILATTDKSQISILALQPGQVSGEYGTTHPQADQALYCVSGSGEVTCEDLVRKFGEGDLVLIPAGANHQVRGGPCLTLNFYGPVAFPPSE